MDRLRSLFVALGFPDADTFIASGNVTFASRARSARALTSTLEQGLAEALGYAVPVFLRTADQVAALIAHQPFDAALMREAQVLNIGFLREPLGKSAVATMTSFNTASDRFATKGTEFFWLSHTRQSESPFFKVKFDRTFGTDVTFRTRGTVLKFAARYHTGS
jgi:uncharacterized protein (DUF1697 family)